MNSIDHKVNFRAYETLLFIAMEERIEAGIDHLCRVKWRKFVERYIGRAFPGRGNLALNLFDNDAEPFVKLMPFSLNVNREMWTEASQDEPLACFKILHELAHILLHRHPKSSFSISQTSKVNFAQDEESAEWQANIFATLIMAPPYLASECFTSKDLDERFGFPSEFSEFWLQWRKRRPLVPVSEFCRRCGHQPMMRIAGRLKCLNCGHTR